MYVCICNAVPESAIHRLVAEGVTSFEEIQLITGCSQTCGSCHDHAHEVLHEALRRTCPPGQLPIVANSAFAA